MSKVIDYINTHQDEAVAELFELLAIPSVSTQPEHAEHMAEAAEWLCSHLAGLGLKAEVVPTAGHPLVVAQSDHQQGKPTVLIYGHYDVQPPDPLEEWLSKPFEPTVRDGFIFARGASDDKGQLMCHLAAVRGWMRTLGQPPLNVKFVLEGEEECTGDSLADYIRANESRLAADYVVVSDGSQLRPGVPAITYGLRGIVYMEVILHGPRQDLHSGVYGGAVANPANVLCRLIEGLHDQNGRITLEGFYEGAEQIDPQERQVLAELGSNDEQVKSALGVPALVGESGYSSRERTWARPSLDVNGLVSGYIQPGAKTIIPARASAKISMRLVDRQDPQAVKASFQKYFTENAGPGVSVEFIEHGQGKPVLIDRSAAGVQAAKRSLERGFSAPAAFVRSGGSIPVVCLLAEKITPEILLMGFGVPDDNAHSPNERFRLEDYHHGQLAGAYLLGELAGVEI